jgi:hypothetical protein
MAENLAVVVNVDDASVCKQRRKINDYEVVEFKVGNKKEYSINGIMVESFNFLGKQIKGGVAADLAKARLSNGRSFHVTFSWYQRETKRAQENKNRLGLDNLEYDLAHISFVQQLSRKDRQKEKGKWKISCKSTRASHYL